ncbi:hypothetical protein TSOC_008657 [Tetrabaena socialis]|uniref:Spermatogenesis-associated protein 20-like TRX domain-containing protein n=1 Tax=Tetrabaena socialis TaxID=47790 RepID=A0A2J7ZXW9_9CHLO|nr:hypothetical protein TSOC_008657 [Tetrabaena socialis]|eukprot:PNH05113.1 hypothetical protein TSOC_008657 [Tetrabaena socialis]
MVCPGSFGVQKERCHVMEVESFESQEIAELLNRDFVAVKVDREERPDVDRVYVHSVLGPELAPLFCTVYGIEKEGNCNRSDRSDPHEEFVGKNVPYIAVPPAEAAVRLRLPYAADAAEVERRLAAAREALHRVRATRPRPALDDKAMSGLRRGHI